MHKEHPSQLQISGCGQEYNRIACCHCRSHDHGEGEDFGQLPVFTKQDIVASFEKTCKDFIDTNKDLEEKIKTMKKESELLPIKYKFRK